MALANVAWLLAAKYGKKVLVVDWDLEAPGLHRFFRIDPKQITVGLIDLFEIYKARLKEAERSLPQKLVNISSALIEVPLREAVNGGSLFLIGAGKQDSDYVKRVNAFDWNEFYDTWHGYGFFEYLKSELKRTAEIILLDSRTGVTDIGGICTLQLPDIVVLLFALNEQNISGTEFIAESIMKNAPELSENARAPEIMIRPARVEKYLEQDKKNEWEVRAAARLQKYLPESQDSPLKFLKQNSIPYIGAYSFGETPLACESVARRADEPAVSFDALTISILKACGLWIESTSERVVVGPEPSKIVSPEQKRRRAKRIWHDATVGLLVLFVVLFGKWCLEKTLVGEYLEDSTHKLLQYRLIQTRQPEESPIVIVDITDLESSPITPRHPLLNIIEAVAQQHPRAIGIDIDFSPNENGYISPDDPAFFDQCLMLSKRSNIPIILGIRRSQTFPADHWLGAEEYKELAASIFLPTETRKLWSWIQPDPNLPHIRTMAQALTESFQMSGPRVPKTLSWAVHQFSEKDLGGEYRVSEFIVDYSPLQEIERSRIRTIRPEGINAQSHLIQDKIVLIGNATPGETKDSFVVPTRTDPVPGVYLHACGAYTLAVSPLYELTNKGRWALDIALSLFILALITGIRLAFNSVTSSDPDTNWLQKASTFVVVLGAFLVAIIFVRTTRILWDDFTLITLLLILHTRVEVWLRGLWEFVKIDVAAALQRRIFPRGRMGGTQ